MNCCHRAFDVNNYGDRRNCSTRVTSPEDTHVRKTSHRGILSLPDSVESHQTVSTFIQVGGGGGVDCSCGGPIWAGLLHVLSGKVGVGYHSQVILPMMHQFWQEGGPYFLAKESGEKESPPGRISQEGVSCPGHGQVWKHPGQGLGPPPLPPIKHKVD